MKRSDSSLGYTSPSPSELELPTPDRRGTGTDLINDNDDVLNYLRKLFDNFNLEADCPCSTDASLGVDVVIIVEAHTCSHFSMPKCKMYPQADPAAAGWHFFVVYSQIWAVDYDSWSIFPVDETIRQSHPVIFLPAPDDPIYILNLIFRVHAMGEQFILMRQDNFAINGWVCETLHTSYGDAHACLPIPPESIVTPSHVAYPQTSTGDLGDYVDEDEGYDEEYDDYPRQTLQHTLVGFSREQVDPASPFTPEMGPEPHTNIHAHDFSLFAPVVPAEQYPNPNNVHVHNAAHVVHSSNSSVSGDTVDSLTIYGAPPTKVSITQWVDEVKTKRLPRKCPLSNCRQTEFRRPHALKVSQILVVQ